MRVNSGSTLLNNQGMITLDFLFAFSLVMGLSAMLFALSFTLTVTEITQYLTFSAARSYSASHISKSYQADLANRKYAELINNPVFKPLYTNGWFEVDKEISPANYAELYPKTQRSIFIGVRVSLLAKMLDFHVPFYGSTSSTETENEGFRTNIASYLGREPTINECISDFTQQRWVQIRNLHESYSQNTTDQGYQVITDNGC